MTTTQMSDGNDLVPLSACETSGATMELNMAREFLESILPPEGTCSMQQFESLVKEIRVPRHATQAQLLDAVKELSAIKDRLEFAVSKFKRRRPTADSALQPVTITDAPTCVRRRSSSPTSNDPLDSATGSTVTVHRDCCSNE